MPSSRVAVRRTRARSDYRSVWQAVRRAGLTCRTIEAPDGGLFVAWELSEEALDRLSVIARRRRTTAEALFQGIMDAFAADTRALPGGGVPDSSTDVSPD